jgi:hypothetical protein
MEHGLSILIGKGLAVDMDTVWWGASPTMKKKWRKRQRLDV